ncbi:response regulator [uncultured Roseobacter sp.]|uniref:response regulator n=1 Tax=uncultured Roseobacter sp. TaxID=114847 RepID=UPI00263494A0|nr:response regulator [uncultured Roseobacter sp.]
MITDATFLLVDDDAVAILAVRRALKRLKITSATLAASDGQDALAVLRDAEPAENSAVVPFIVILDLQMPRMGGLEFLDALVGDERLQDVMVLVFAPPEMHHLIKSRYDQHVRGFLDKDRTEETLAQALTELRDSGATVSG